jgi:hypothetical protein
MISIARAYRIPIFMHEETYRVVAVRRDCEHIEKLDRELVRHHTDERFTVGPFSVHPFPIFHDGGFAGKPYGFSITCGDNGTTSTKAGASNGSTQRPTSSQPAGGTQNAAELKIEEEAVGAGPAAKSGDKVTVHYTGLPPRRDRSERSGSRPHR